MRNPFDPSSAIAELDNALYVARTNEPINRREGNKAQADAEIEHARSFKGAIAMLKKSDFYNRKKHSPWKN